MSNDIHYSAEENLISCVFMAGLNAHFRASTRGVATSVFTDSRNARVWSAIDLCVASGSQIAMDVVASKLSDLGELQSAGGFSHLIKVTSERITTSNLETYIDQVLRAHAVRRARSAIATLSEGLDGSMPIDSISESIETLMAIVSGDTLGAEKTWNEVVSDSIAMLEKMDKDKGLDPATSIMWPWSRLDDEFKPMQAGQLVILAARPSVGKSSLARPIAVSAAVQGKGVYYVTLEVNPVRIPISIASALTGVTVSHFYRNSRSDKEAVIDAVKKLKGLNFTITAKDRSLQRILSRARALKAHGKIDLLVIDHGLLLQDVQQARAGDKVGEISRVTGALKSLAQELGIVVLLLWQINRDSEKDSNRAPALSDLKGSGSLEEDADKVIMLHRPDVNPETGQQQRSNSLPSECPTFFINIAQEKGRDDGTGLISFDFRRETTSFKLHAK